MTASKVSKIYINLVCNKQAIEKLVLCQFLLPARSFSSLYPEFCHGCCRFNQYMFINFDIMIIIYFRLIKIYDYNEEAMQRKKT